MKIEDVKKPLKDLVQFVSSMDLDVNEGTFDSRFPLPFRVAFIISLGIWAYASSLHLLHLSGVDPVPILHPRRRRGLSPQGLYRPIYDIAIAVTAFTALCLAVFWGFTGGDEVAIIEWEVLPLSCFAFLAAVLFSPFNVLHQHWRYQFLSSLGRVLTGGIGRDTKFADVMLADILTSYAKVLGDLWVTGCMFLTGVSTTSKPDRACGGKYVIPLVLSIPYFIRLRQCITEYRRARDSGIWHILNAVKYSTAFPVIILSAMQRSYISPLEEMNPEKVWFGEVQIWRLWILAVLINSIYSFWWDVVKDWDLTILTVDPAAPGERLWGLRSRLHFPSKMTYYVAVVLDLCLRMTWSLKLSTHLHHLNDLEGGIFMLETVEVIRRWMWIVFRVETEWVRKGGTHSGYLPLEAIKGDLEDGEMEMGEMSGPGKYVA
ncbi:hypothetical protein G7K_1311-t1 [Saitoella complicata NRRL Y-17804]|uniref:EXS domain-containing protein n=2 Tax=Saitoella complicata (strain BCRC 22490 / CBS 7301 / JCM 7358 / NBRC 10748 / NRRL Y-17804) TaxID=698492 RepID=A0A0E9NB82_SAICN|nr:hypothetical protein G7K_1311-t1 [Saitoella complicata NRRL Y-17804]